MSPFRLLLQSLLYHWRGNSAVLLGVLVGSTVLTGALLVGDSLQGSLWARSLRQLGWVDQALVTPRFFRQQLADEVRATAEARVAPAILLRSTVVVPGDAPLRKQARGVTILGVDDAFFPPGPVPGPPFVQINAELARELDLREGAALDIRLVKPSALPREAALARKDVAIGDWRVEVTRVLTGDEPGNHFNLRPAVEAPRTVLVPLSQLQEQLGIGREVNALLAAGEPTRLRSALEKHLTLEDHGLTLFTPARRAQALLARYDRNRDGILRGTEWARRSDGKRQPRFAEVLLRGMKQAKPDILTHEEITEFFQRQYPYLTLESKQLLLSATTSRRAQEAAAQVGLHADPLLVYLARLSAGEKRIAGVVAAVPPDFLDGTGAKLAGPDDIVVIDSAWPEGQRPRAGEAITLTYKPPESHGPAADLKHEFRLAGLVPLTGRLADPALTPEFPGITDKDDTSDWTLPFDDPAWDQQTIRREYTDAYWDAYRATPKAYIRLDAGRRLWSSRFGDTTSIRFRLTGANDPAALTDAAQKLAAALLASLPPEDSGFVFDPVKASAQEASRGGTPFGLLFLGFSFFLILSALLLVGLLFRLNLDRRAQQVGLLFAEGFPRRRVLELLLGEGSVLALVGAGLGLLVALGYSRMLVQLLTALWPGGGLRSFLEPYWTWTSLAAGAGGAFLVSVLTVAWVVRQFARVPPRMLLAGRTTGEGEPGLAPPARWPLPVVMLSVLVGLVLLVVGPFIPGHEAKAGTFFSSGGLFLTAGLVGLFAWMRKTRHRSVEGQGWWNIAWLGVRNAARYPARSLLTAGLLASASFLLVAVESFRRHVHAGEGTIHEPDGGFALVAESDLPIVRDLNSPPGRREMLDRLERRLQARMAPEEVRRTLDEAETLLRETTIVALRARSGDDASCLNLFQPRAPRVLGVPRSLIQRGGFVVASSLASTAEEKANPWLVLLREGEAVPSFGEGNTVLWMLKSGLGGTLQVPDQAGDLVTFQVAGLLQDSVFQSSLLVSEERFLRLYPDHEGYNYFLITPPAGRADEVKQLLEAALDERGLVVARSADRLEAFLAVENTYLTTFQALGGLGLILGSLGLAVVLLRSIWERRAELALFRALGWNRRTLGWLVLSENAFLLLVGLLIGSGAALLSISPQLFLGEGSVPWPRLLVLFTLVLAVALAAGAVSVWSALRAPLVPALRRE
ncbi:MAG: ABC transporter permease [Gemmataceae bacterium]